VSDSAITPKVRELSPRLGRWVSFLRSHAIAIGVTLVTDNVGELARVRDLEIENWRE